MLCFFKFDNRSNQTMNLVNELSFNVSGRVRKEMCCGKHG